MAQLEFHLDEDGKPTAFRASTGAAPVEPTQPQEPETASASRRPKRRGTTPASLEAGRV